MDIFIPTINQTAFLFSLIVIGYILAKMKAIPENATAVLSKLENTVFIPALVMGTFMKNFKMEIISEARDLFLASFAVAVIIIPFAVIIPKLITKDRYIQNIYTYGLAFSNFGFMGNAVVSSIFPDIFMQYLIFTLPLWILIYMWGVPKLLISDPDKKQTFKENLKAFVNPMFICMIIGMVIGITQIKTPAWLMSVVETSGNCMSPIAMLLTGMIVSSISLKKTFSNLRIYVVSVIRLVIIPLVFMFILSFFDIDRVTYICIVCSLSMPLGLSTIVITSAMGKDTSVAAGMTLISHMLACITIPVIFTLF